MFYLRSLLKILLAYLLSGLVLVLLIISLTDLNSLAAANNQSIMEFWTSSSPWGFLLLLLLGWPIFIYSWSSQISQGLSKSTPVLWLILALVILIFAYTIRSISRDYKRNKALSRSE